MERSTHVRACKAPNLVTHTAADVFAFATPHGRDLPTMSGCGVGRAPTCPLALNAVIPLRMKAEAAGSSDFSPLWAGQNATGCREISAGELTRQLAAG